MRKKKTSVYNWVLNALIIICALVLLLCALMIFWKTRDYRAGGDSYRETASVAVRARETTPPEARPMPTPGADGIVAIGEAEALPTVELPPIEVDFDRLSAVRGEVAGWMYCEGTVLNYPLAGGRTDEFYLSHLLDGTRNAMGTLYIDDDNATDFSDRNTIIHGHHMKNGSMFGWLESYKEQAFYEAHDVIYLLTPNGDYRLEPIAGYVSTASGSAYEQWFEDDAAFTAYIADITARSDFQTHADVRGDDRIVTLSTCAYVFDNARYVLHTKLVPIG